MRFSIIIFFAFIYFFIVTESAPNSKTYIKSSQVFCRDFADYFKTWFQCDLSGAFVSPDKPKFIKPSNSKIITNSNLLPGNAIPEKDINFKEILQRNNENHFPGGVDDIIPIEQDEIPVPVIEFNNGINNPVAPNSPVIINNELPDFNALLPYEGINLAETSVSTGASVLGVIGSILV
ncbi:hypothetical protein BB561_004536 [Smittium simulii]|uniref:Uncharacterized protein n=1 Tax=Smittium simulii TaxID=133385 RepID=A0A2T9YFP7_9FUNG|nr:hypothetical protein BB561_004536 [Smittium simulii]